MCRCTVSVCPPIRLSVTFVYSVETSKYIFDLVFHAKPYGNIATKTLLRGGASNARGARKSAIFDQCLASSRVVHGATITCYKHCGAGQWQVGDTHRW